MHSTRTILFRTFLGGILFAPLFVLAQTTTPVGTSTAPTADQILQQQLEQQLKDLTQKRDDLLAPDVSGTSAKLLLQNLDVKVSPENPGPSETIRVNIESYLADLDKATLTWVLDGKTVQRGTGKRSFSFTNGPSGKTTRLSIHITTQNGETITKELSWNPVGLTVLWEADTYTPPFYRGKALLSSQANVRAIAIPDNTGGTNALSAGNFAYVWQKDGTNVSSASGYGKNLFTFPAPKPYGKTSVSVLASSVDGQTSTEKQINLPVTQPFILFYEDTPLLGVWYNRPIGSNFTLTKRELSVSAEPFFFSKEDSDTSTLKYNWSVNGAATKNSGRTITLRNDTGAQGISLVSLATSGIKKVFQSATQSINVSMAGNKDTGSRPTF